MSENSELSENSRTSQSSEKFRRSETPENSEISQYSNSDVIEEEFLEEELDCSIPSQGTPSDKETDSEAVLFKTNLSPVVREFKGQSSAPKLNAWVIQSSGIEDFLGKLWLKVKPLLKREALFAEQKFQWGDAEILLEDLSRFVLIYTKIGRRTYDLDQITTANLSHWAESELTVYIHMYSLSVSSQAMFKKLKKQLLDADETDRAGAAAISQVYATVTKLKEIHKENFKGSDIAFTMWANLILASDAHRHEALMLEPPPTQICDLFTRAQDSGDMAFQRAQQNVSVGAFVAEAHCKDLQEMQSLMAKFSGLVTELNFVEKEMKRKLEQMETRSRNSYDVLQTVHRTSSVQENEFSREIFSQISNCDDFQHS